MANNYLQSVAYILLANQKGNQAHVPAGYRNVTMQNLLRAFDTADENWDEMTDSMTLLQHLSGEVESLGENFEVEQVVDENNPNHSEVYLSYTFPGEPEPRSVSLSTVLNEAEYGIIGANLSDRLNLMDNYYDNLTPPIMRQISTSQEMDTALYSMQNDVYLYRDTQDVVTGKRAAFASRFLAETKALAHDINPEFSAPYTALVRETTGKGQLEQISTKGPACLNLRNALSKGFAEMLATRFDQANLQPEFVGAMLNKGLEPAGSAYSNEIVKQAFLNGGQVSEQKMLQDLVFAQDVEFRKGKEDRDTAYARASAVYLSSLQTILDRSNTYSLSAFAPDARENFRQSYQTLVDSPHVDRDRINQMVAAARQQPRQQQQRAQQQTQQMPRQQQRQTRGQRQPYEAQQAAQQAAYGQPRHAAQQQQRQRAQNPYAQAQYAQQQYMNQMPRKKKSLTQKAVSAVGKGLVTAGKLGVRGVKAVVLNAGDVAKELKQLENEAQTEVSTGTKIKYGAAVFGRNLAFQAADATTEARAFISNKWNQKKTDMQAKLDAALGQIDFEGKQYQTEENYDQGGYPEDNFGSGSFV